jgi:hypothetical protein
VGIGPHEYLAAFADDLSGGGVIQFTQVLAPDASCPTDSIRLDCPDVWTAVEGGSGHRASAPITLTLPGANPVHSAAWLQLALADRERVHVAVYDVFGRRVRALAEGWVPAGTTTLLWDGRADQGAAASSGIYFVRATSTTGRSVVRVLMIR